PDRVGDRVRDHDQGRAVDYRGDIRVLGEDPVDQLAVGDIALVEGDARGKLTAAGDQAVQDHRADPRVRAGVGESAADVSGSPGDQYLHSGEPTGGGIRRKRTSVTLTTPAADPMVWMP